MPSLGLKTGTGDGFLDGILDLVDNCGLVPLGIGRELCLLDWI